MTLTHIFRRSCILKKKLQTQKGNLGKQSLCRTKLLRNPHGQRVYNVIGCEIVSRIMLVRDNCPEPEKIF